MKIKELRKQKGKTQEELANYLNVSRATYNGYELNKYEPNIETIKKLANYYNVSTDYILECNNKFDLGYIDNETEEIINKIKLLNKEQKARLNGYLTAMLENEKFYNNELNKFKTNSNN